MDCIKLLLEAGAAVDIKDFNGRTAYDLAVNEGRISIASLLRPDITEHKSAHPKDQVADRQAIRARLKAKEKLDRKMYREMILHSYSRLQPSLFSFQKSFFQESFLRAIEEGSRESLLAILEEVHPGIFVFPMLSPDYCSMMLEELDNFEQSGLPLKRPNSMNNYGVILNDIGFKDAMYELLERYINPFASLLFAEDGGLSLDRHHSFVVKYKLGEDLDLKEHVDDSDVTLNVCLGKEFEGGELEFNGVLGTKTSKKDKFLLSHRPGFGILHLGKHWHAARPILK
ncbi:Ogfod2 protein, variant 2 [Balamuthia mandrillaris]